uniref:Cytochrome c oxidase subunit 2 n=1 Tax=Pristaulacus compressus TaxID=1414807 RepID=U5TUM8_9HYME|nr:cytochrome c oxidase subunit II [Pristaulacus compressus]AGZ13113.1 cytochrome c oxidase subunit II [Pristaulacus compressus]
MSLWMHFSSQNACSPLMEHLIFFHDYSMMLIIIIISLIFYTILFILTNLNYNHFLIENQMIELIWTISPMLILIFLALPSLKILYLSDETFLSFFTVKITGHQWFWTYEFSDFFNIEFDSFMMNKLLKMNSFRLLDVDSHFIIPMNLNIRLLINSSDVIHSWTIPSMGIKIDAIPGRLNQISLITKRPGLFFGQCSEICGINHSFMPIVLESTKMNLFFNWLYKFI